MEQDIAFGYLYRGWGITRMKLIVEITDEYYKLLQEYPVYQCTSDMLILKMGKPLIEPKYMPYVNIRAIESPKYRVEINTKDETVVITRDDVNGKCTLEQLRAMGIFKEDKND